MEEMLKKDVIFEELKDRIVRLDYEPGTILNEVDLAEEFDVSRTPLRQAFQKLEKHKLIDVVPRYGTQVSQIDFKNMKALFEVTKVLDPFAVRLACEHITEEQLARLEEIVGRMKGYDMATQYKEAIKDDGEFHEIILEASDNAWLQEILTDLHYHTERLWNYTDTFFKDSSIFYDTLNEVIKGIRAEDGERAAEAQEKHIESFTDKIKDTIL